MVIVRYIFIIIHNHAFSTCERSCHVYMYTPDSLYRPLPTCTRYLSMVNAAADSKIRFVKPNQECPLIASCLFQPPEQCDCQIAAPVSATCHTPSIQSNVPRFSKSIFHLALLATDNQLQKEGEGFPNKTRRLRLKMGTGLHARGRKCIGRPGHGFDRATVRHRCTVPVARECNLLG